MSSMDPTDQQIVDELVGPVYPPNPVGIERAWHQLMRQIGNVNVGYAHGVKVNRRALRAFMRDRGYTGRFT